MIDTISYDTADTNRRVLLHNGNKDFKKYIEKSFQITYQSNNYILNCT